MHWINSIKNFIDCIFQQHLSLVMLLEMHHVRLKERKGFVALNWSKSYLNPFRNATLVNALFYDAQNLMSNCFVLNLLSSWWVYFVHLLIVVGELCQGGFFIHQRRETQIAVDKMSDCEASSSFFEQNWLLNRWQFYLIVLLRKS